MKKIDFRTLVWAALFTASLSSYIYLHSASVKEYGTCPSAINQHEEGFEGKQESKIFLPDIALVKKLLNITKIVMPKD